MNVPQGLPDEMINPLPIVPEGGGIPPIQAIPTSMDGSLSMPSPEEMANLEAMGEEDIDLLTPEEQAELGLNIEDTLIPEGQGEDHYRNLAKGMDRNDLDTIAQDLIELVEADDNSRKDWHDRVIKGIRNLGVSSKTFGGAEFPGASKVVHPVLMEACTQFQARAIQEMWPSDGPVKTKVLGIQSKDKLDQAKRVSDYMNYLYMTKMTEAFDQEDNMLLRLPISGSAFKKMFYDPLKKRLSSLFVEPADFIISYQTTDLASSPRFTHRIREYSNDVRKKEASGFYVRSKKGDTHSEDTDKPGLIDEIDHTQGTHRTTSYAEDENEERATMYEIYVDYNVEDLEAAKVPDAKDEIVLKPYIITIDRDMQTVKRIQRNWKPDDELQTKRMYFSHYKFTPGLGFYGFGFLHLIGDMSETATGALRALLDSAQFSNLQGGFKTRHSKVPGTNKPLKPGEWREIDSTAEELKDAFYAVPYKEPSATLFNLLSYVDEKARHLAGITETNSGEATPNHAPVGTTAMLLEQGTKVFTAIHKRMHNAHKNEFNIMAELVEEYMPDDGYPYLLGTAEGTLMPQDFDKKIDVIPVSDPNISSNAQRVAKAQSILELQQTYPNVIGERVAVKRMLEAIQAHDMDELIGNDEQQAANDEKMAAKQEDMERLEKAKVESDIDKMRADVKQISSIAVKNNLDAIQASFEAAALAATSKELIPMADELMSSSGFKDEDGGMVMDPRLVPAQPVSMDPGLAGPETNANIPQAVGDETQMITGQAGDTQINRLSDPQALPAPEPTPEGQLPSEELPGVAYE